MKKRTLLTILVGLLLVGCASVQPNLHEIGFVLESTDFGDPCTNDPGDFPVIYDNASSNSVDVSFQIFNTGGSNIFVVGTGFVIPPLGPSQRPRVIRLTVAPGNTIKLNGQAEDCSWKSIILPH